MRSSLRTVAVLTLIAIIAGCSPAAEEAASPEAEVGTATTPETSLYER